MIEWLTEHELDHLRSHWKRVEKALAQLPVKHSQPGDDTVRLELLERRATNLRLYCEAAERRSDWGRIDARQVKIEARLLLRDAEAALSAERLKDMVRC